jgi:hypothetical protein
VFGGDLFHHRLQRRDVARKISQQIEPGAFDLPASRRPGRAGRRFRPCGFGGGCCGIRRRNGADQRRSPQGKRLTTGQFQWFHDLMAADSV